MNISYLRRMLYAFLICALAACTNSNPIIVSIDDNELRNKYIDVLSKSKLNYTINEYGEILVYVKDYATLRKKTKEYYAFRKERIDELNRKINETQ